MPNPACAPAQARAVLDSGDGRMKANRMKEKLYAGEPAFGVSVMIPSPQIVEMIGAAGFDWVLLDCEHGTLAD
jgi:2-keto-3-deoxy-L-rhamnonate aldolase RhmA